jgi:hypothetical protein
LGDEELEVKKELAVGGDQGGKVVEGELRAGRHALEDGRLV